jgi:hypothetical protein
MQYLKRLVLIVPDLSSEIEKTKPDVKDFLIQTAREPNSFVFTAFSSKAIGTAQILFGSQAIPHKQIFMRHEEGTHATATQAFQAIHQELAVLKCLDEPCNLILILSADVAAVLTEKIFTALDKNFFPGFGKEANQEPLYAPGTVAIFNMQEQSYTKNAVPAFV